jgi:hypothetical protein
MRRSTVPAPRAHSRAGFTLMETVLGLSVLAGAVLASGRYFTALAFGVANERTRATANFLVTERFEQVKTAPTYAGIESLYSGTETSIANYPGYSRLTSITRIGGLPSDSVDYKIVTVTVTTPAVPKNVQVTKSLAIADF